MLIKINESGKDFEKTIEELKYRTGESTASKAALFAINEYVVTKKALTAKELELKRLQSTMEVLQALFRQKNQAEDGIRGILK